MGEYIAKGLNVSCRTIDGEAFIFDQDTKLLLQLDEVGSFIWDQINGVSSIQNIVEMCYQRYDDGGDDIATAVREFVMSLHSQNLVVFSDRPFEEEMISAC